MKGNKQTRRLFNLLLLLLSTLIGISHRSLEVAVAVVVVVDFLASTKKHLAELGQTANAVFVTHSCCSEPLVARCKSH